MELIYEEKQVLRTSDYDMNDNIKIHSLFDIFQDLAGRHAEMLGLGYSIISKKNLCWVLISNKIEFIDKIPYGKEVVLRTWPSANGRIDFIRDYEIEVDGKVVLKASSRWVVINYLTRALTRTTEVNFNYQTPNKRNFSEFKKLKVKVPESKEECGSYKVVLNDLDHNGHMNNSKYVEMLYNMVGKNGNFNYKSIQIDYHHEAMFDDVIKVYKFIVNDSLYYVGYIENVESFIIELKGER